MEAVYETRDLKISGYERHLCLCSDISQTSLLLVKANLWLLLNSASNTHLAGCPQVGAVAAPHAFAGVYNEWGLRRSLSWAGCIMQGEEDYLGPETWMQMCPVRWGSEKSIPGRGNRGSVVGSCYVLLGWQCHQLWWKWYLMLSHIS